MLYTIIDWQEVLLDNKINKNSKFIKQYGNVYLECRKDQGKYKIERVISTDLKDYLNNDYNIGDLL